MIKKGKIGWMPKPLIDEITIVKKSEGIQKDSKAIKKIVDYSKKGREYANLDIDYNAPISTIWRKKR